MTPIDRDELKPVFEDLNDAFTATNIDYYLIGAMARDTWYAKGDLRFRATKDVDFAVFVGSKAEYEAVRNYLQEQKNYRQSTTNAFVIISPEGLAVDLLPFGAIEIDESVSVEGMGLVNIKVNGFLEVYNGGVEDMEVLEGHHFKVATLPAIVLLKFIAFDDRPEKRLKDARDIANIITNYFELQSDLIFENHHDLYKEDMPERQPTEIAAIVIGREIRKMLNDNPALHNRIIKIIEEQVHKFEESIFIKNMSHETGESLEEMKHLLLAVIFGLQGE
jgi:predicted nucleotidyltransferase